MPYYIKSALCSVLLAKYYSVDQKKKTDMGRALSTYAERRDAYRILVETSEGRSPSERLRSRWEDNMKMDLREVGMGRAWIGRGSEQRRVVSFCEGGDEPLGSLKCGRFLD